MAHYYHYIKNEAAPFKDLARLLDHLWADELRDYAASPTPRHIFHQLVSVANWLNAGTAWTPEQYVASFESAPEVKWLAARTETERAPAETTAAEQPATSDPRPRWEYEGYGSRYRVRGKQPSILAIVGWDRPLSTYFAQVWDVPAGAKHHEHGKLLLWAGTDWDEVPGVDELIDLVAKHAELPWDLQLRLEADRLAEEFGSLG